MHRFVACFFILAVAATVLASPAPRVSDSRIIGGKTIAITEANYQASLMFDGIHFCGGTIISTMYVITAAHCTNRLDPSKITVRVGSSSRISGGHTSSVLAISPNPMYNEKSTNYDMSILTVSTFDLNAKVGTVLLPSAFTVFPTGTPVFATGWGFTMEGANTQPNMLQGVNMVVLDVLKCKSANSALTITDWMLCAGVDEGGKDTCKGDDGGPLVSNGVLVGISSWGGVCDNRGGHQGFYTNVAYSRDFITKITGL